MKTTAKKSTTWYAKAITKPFRWMGTWVENITGKATPQHFNIVEAMCTILSISVVKPKFQPGVSNSPETVVKNGSEGFLIDTEGNVLTHVQTVLIAPPSQSNPTSKKIYKADFSLYSGGQKTELKIGNKAIHGHLH